MTEILERDSLGDYDDDYGAPSTEVAPPAQRQSLVHLSAGLTGAQKAAVLLISLGEDVAADLMGRLGPGEVEAIAAEMASMPAIRPETTLAVMEETLDALSLGEGTSVGGPEYARQVLVHLVGETRADEIMSELGGTYGERPFEFLHGTEPEQVSAFLRDESPQTIALVVASVGATLASKILMSLEPALQAEVARRVATMGETTPAVVMDVEQGLRTKLSSVHRREFASAGGVDALADILNRSGRSTERNVVGSIAETDEPLAEEIRSRMFTFDDIVKISDRDLQLVLRDIDGKELQLALRGVDVSVVEKVLSNMSERGAEMLREDMQAQAPQRRQLVEDAQNKIVAAIRRLDDEGTIVLRSGGVDDDEVL